jgi:hypothetical protein
MAFLAGDPHIILRETDMTLGPTLDTLLLTIRLKGASLSKISIINCKTTDSMLDKIRTVLSHHAPQVQLNILPSGSAVEAPTRGRSTLSPPLSPKVCTRRRDTNAFHHQHLAKTSTPSK